MGGMAAFIPSRRDAEVNAVALAKVREDKEREAAQGFDGTWVAHPDLVPVALEAFDRVLGERPNQIDRQRDDVHVDAARPARRRGDAGRRSPSEGCATTSRSGIQYLAAWLNGNGAVAINNLMEDAATAEISPLADLAMAPPRPGRRLTTCAGSPTRRRRDARRRLRGGARAVRADRDAARVRRVPDAARVRPSHA